MTRDHLRLPPSTTFQMGAYVGRFSSAVIIALIPDHPVFIVEELPNYHYVGDGEIELAGMTTVEWGESVVRMFRFYAGKDARCHAWVDPDTEFGKEMKRCKLRLRKNLNHGPELRTEVLREYFHDNKIFYMPWLKTLPYEIQRAQWPAEESAAFHERLTGSDYSLSALEQVISRRPLATAIAPSTPSDFIARLRSDRGITANAVSDPHLGRL